MIDIQCSFNGRLFRDAEFRLAKGGTLPMLTFSIPCGGKNWLRVVVFKETAEQLRSELVKGTEVYVEGRLSVDTWTGKDSRDRTGVSVMANQVIVQAGKDRRSAKAVSSRQSLDFPDDQIPF